MANGSTAEQFEKLYTRLWAALHRPDDPDLTQHERELLHHVPADGGVDLTGLARHLALPKSTASVLVKDLARRGFLIRQRDPADERRLRLVLSNEGRARVAADRVLDPDRLARALARLDPPDRAALLRTLTSLADAAENA
jgi:DNA-binding MarR family transcriptional regulator